MERIYKVIDTFNGKEYHCSSKSAVKSVIASITDLPRNSEEVKEAAKGYSESFIVEDIDLYTSKD